MNKIQSCGGLVINEKHQLLLIFKKNRWDLPKGKKENIQSHKETALREVSEETGLDVNGINQITELIPTHHYTRYEGNKVLKETIWYYMKYKGDSFKLKPQEVEGIIHAKWVSIWKLNEYLQHAPLRIQYIVDFFLKNIYYPIK